MRIAGSHIRYSQFVDTVGDYKSLVMYLKPPFVNKFVLSGIRFLPDESQVRTGIGSANSTRPVPLPRTSTSYHSRNQNIELPFVIT
jgi:hypothetical protein